MVFDRATNFARGNLGVPPEWVCYSVAILENGPRPAVVKIKGAIFPILVRGPRKGQPNWRKRQSGSTETFYIRPEDLHPEDAKHGSEV